MSGEFGKQPFLRQGRPPKGGTQNGDYSFESRLQPAQAMDVRKFRMIVYPQIHGEAICATSGAFGKLI
jgi:hypothetical protein